MQHQQRGTSIGYLVMRTNDHANSFPARVSARFVGGNHVWVVSVGNTAHWKYELASQTRGVRGGGSTFAVAADASTKNREAKKPTRS